MAIQSKFFGSSAIQDAIYDDETQELTIRFEGGRGAGSYDFSNFSEIEWARFIAASSPGSYYNANIKGRY